MDGLEKHKENERRKERTKERKTDRLIDRKKELLLLLLPLLLVLFVKAHTVLVCFLILHPGLESMVCLTCSLHGLCKVMSSFREKSL